MRKTRKRVVIKDDHRNIVTGNSSRSTFEILNNRDSDGDGIPDSIDPAPTIVDDRFRYAKVSCDDFARLDDNIKANIEYRPTDDGYIIRADEVTMEELDVMVRPIKLHKYSF